MSIEAMKQALEALKSFAPHNGVFWRNLHKEDAEIANVIASLRQAIEQAEKQEPVAWMYEWDGKKHLTFTDQRFVEQAHPHFNKSTPLYTTPQPHREWVGLTPTDIADALGPCPKYFSEWTDADVIYFARTLDAKLKEKNT